MHLTQPCIALLVLPLFVVGDKPGTIAERFPPPQGCARVAAGDRSFEAYLRSLPLKPEASPVLLYNGRPKARQDVHAAVLDVSTGPKDLQQCADAVIRLRAEYLFANGRQDEIAFHFTNGFLAEWSRWRAGGRIRINGDKCQWSRSAAADASHDQLLSYLDVVFTYAGTRSLAQELVSAVERPIRGGDVFIQAGGPGHAMIVLDVAVDAGGERYFLLGQSYMPAQDMHVVKNPDGSGPWFKFGTDAELVTPEWTFRWGDRKRFR